MVPASAVSLSGETAFRQYVSDGGNVVEHHFCADCGSPLFGKSQGMPDGVAFRAASLDDPSWFRPQFHLYTASAQPWARIPSDIPAFPKMPPVTGRS
jgi:hypothetical protein